MRKRDMSPLERKRRRLGMAVLRAGADPVKRARAIAARTAFVNKYWPDADASSFANKNGG